MRVRLHDLVSEMAVWQPDTPALTFGDTTMTYAQLWRCVERVARGLVLAGVARGERVAVYAEKRIETVVSIFAVSAAGGVVVPVNPLLRARQVQHVLDDCSVRALITTADRFQTLDPELRRGCGSLQTVVLFDPGPDGVADDDRFGLRAWAELGADDLDVPLPAGGYVDSDIGAILYTSGSTGRPKGVVLSHRNMIVGAESVSQYLGVSSADRILAALPLSFDAGLSQLTTSFATGAHVVLVNYLLPKDIVRLCAEHRITGLTGVPPFWIQVAEQEWPDEAAVSMRFFANTGGRMPRITLKRLQTIFPGAAPYLMYGLTEAFRSTYLDPAEVERRPDSIGKAIPNAEIMVVRGDGGLCDPGEEGELVHRGPLVCMGYWNDPERTAERFRPAPGRPGELCLPEIAVWSGDIVVRDEEGFLYFVGRRDEMIKTSGYRVSPSEVEEVAYEAGSVKDAVAVGVDDERLGQHIVLIVSLRDGCTLEESAMLSQMRAKLPLFMVPKRVLIRPDLPRSANGKFDRALLRVKVAQETAVEQV
jgi:acyl-CoA ligase (AMP-forming) (exosortase A-associated)